MSICPSHAGIVSKRLNVLIGYLHHSNYSIQIVRGKNPTGTPYGGDECRIYLKNRNFRPISRFTSAVIQDRDIATSPILFCIYIDDLLSGLANLGVGCYIGNWYTGALAYADDIVLMAPNANAMHA